MFTNRSSTTDWPDIPYNDWAGSLATLHLWTQVIGKIRLERTPWTNHSWHVPLYLNARGLASSPIAHGAHIFEMEFDFLAHQMAIRTADGSSAQVALKPRSVADFYSETMSALDKLGLATKIYTTPSEIADAIPFEKDETHRDYDPGSVNRFWRALLQVDRVFKEFRARFSGKCSPVHFFWGSFDLAVTRFSGREAPPHPGGVPNFPDWVAREAYSHEVSSAGFWPGGGGVDYPAFYSYAYPAPDNFSTANVQPGDARWSDELGEFLLPYDAVRLAKSPDDTLLTFLQSTYEAAADPGNWDREALERRLVPPREER